MLLSIFSLVLTLSFSAQNVLKISQTLKFALFDKSFQTKNLKDEQILYFLK